MMIRSRWKGPRRTGNVVQAGRHGGSRLAKRIENVARTRSRSERSWLLREDLFGLKADVDGGQCRVKKYLCKRRLSVFRVFLFMFVHIYNLKTTCAMGSGVTFTRFLVSERIPTKKNKPRKKHTHARYNLTFFDIVCATQIILCTRVYIHLVVLFRRTSTVRTDSTAYRLRGVCAVGVVSSWRGRLMNRNDGIRCAGNLRFVIHVWRNGNSVLPRDVRISDFDSGRENVRRVRRRGHSSRCAVEDTCWQTYRSFCPKVVIARGPDGLEHVIQYDDDLWLQAVEWPIRNSKTINEPALSETFYVFFG